MKNKKNWVIISAILFVITMVTNFLGAAGNINGMSQEAISDKYHTMITPAGFTFSIWGVIYVFILLFLVISFLSKNEDLNEKTYKYFSLTCVFNAIWIVCFSYELLWASVIAIVLLLATLYLCHESLKEGKDCKTKTTGAVAFGLYAGWVTAATTLNVFLTIKAMNLQAVFGLSETGWSVIALILALAIYLFVSSKVKNPLYTVAGAWAYFGIFSSVSESSMSSTALLGVLIAGMIVLIVVSVYRFIKNSNSLLPID